MKQNQKLLVVNINEFNYDFLLKQSKIFRCKNIIKFFDNFNKSKTFTLDKIQHENLDPWVQEVSINTGKNSKNHKIKNLGEKLNSNIVQIWDLISKKFTVSVWGSMNSQLRDNKNIKVFFPDPWNFTSKIKPENLKNLFLLPNYYAKNYTNIRIFDFIKYAVYLIKIIFTSSLVLKHFLTNFFFYLKNIFFIKIPLNFKFFTIFDIISLLILLNLEKKNRSDCVFIFLNSIAHFQHNYWDDEKNYKNYFIFLDKLFFVLNNHLLNYESAIIYNGFTQKRIKPEYLLKPYDPESLLSKFKISFLKSEQNMTNGAILFFKNEKKQKYYYNKMKNFTLGNLYLFDLKKVDKKSFFYKIRIKSNYQKSNKLNFKRKFEYYRTYKKSKKNNPNYDLLNEFKFIKTTGSHINRGLFFHKNLNVKIKKKFQNHYIFNIIKESLNV